MFLLEYFVEQLKPRFKIFSGNSLSSLACAVCFCPSKNHNQLKLWFRFYFYFFTVNSSPWKPPQHIGTTQQQGTPVFHVGSDKVKGRSFHCGQKRHIEFGHLMIDLNCFSSAVEGF